VTALDRIECRAVLLTNLQENGDSYRAYPVAGVLLGDGRLLTRGTGVDGRDSLWSSLESYRPSGLDTCATREIGDSTTIPLGELVAADYDNVKWRWQSGSLLTAAELDAWARHLCAEVATLVGDDGTGDLRAIVDEALRDDRDATAGNIADVVAEARAAADAERERENSS
jgi:hypothetical protein